MMIRQIKNESQKTYDGGMQNMDLGQRGGKYVGGNKRLNLQRWSHVNEMQNSTGLLS